MAKIKCYRLGCDNKKQKDSAWCSRECADIYWGPKRAGKLTAEELVKRVRAIGARVSIKQASKQTTGQEVLDLNY